MRNNVRVAGSSNRHQKGQSSCEMYKEIIIRNRLYYMRTRENKVKKEKEKLGVCLRTKEKGFNSEKDYFLDTFAKIRNREMIRTAR